MMQMRDWISGLVGLIIVLIGLSSFWSRLSFLKDVFSASVLRWIVVVAGVYLAWNSIVEITNSNVVGWGSFIVAIIAAVIGLLPNIPWFEFGLFSSAFYSIVLVIEGIFLMIATFAMEL